MGVLPTLPGIAPDDRGAMEPGPPGCPGAIIGADGKLTVGKLAPGAAPVCGTIVDAPIPVDVPVDAAPPVEPAPS